MRDLITRQKVIDFMQAFGRLAKTDVSVYLTGGSTAVIEGWRETTVDIDIKFMPEPDEMFRGIPEIKESLHLNIELAAPSDFIPELPGWRDRSSFIEKIGKTTFYHYDPYSQVLSKLERSHEKDLLDVEAMFERGMITVPRLKALFDEILPRLYRYPALAPEQFASTVEKWCTTHLDRPKK